jgi:hypothetical protein
MGNKGSKKKDKGGLKDSNAADKKAETTTLSNNSGSSTKVTGNSTPKKEESKNDSGTPRPSFRLGLAPTPSFPADRHHFHHYLSIILSWCY